MCAGAGRVSLSVPCFSPAHAFRPRRRPGPFQPDEKDLVAVKKILAEYFSDKLIKNVGKAVDENKITEADLGRWLNK